MNSQPLPASPEPVIQSLDRCPDALEQLAHWHHQQCLQQGLTASSLPRRRHYLAGHLGPEAIPVTLVASRQGLVLGCVSLVRHGTGEAPDRVWLSNLYVDEAHRRCGLGTQLLASAQDYARDLELPAIWLFTDRQSEYYRARGWQRAGDARVGGGSVIIMTRALNLG